MENGIYVDEKWFHMTKTSTKFYLAQNEAKFLHSFKSKKFITKVRFLAAVVRPRKDYSWNQWFDEKLRISPFIINEPAKRRSKNWPTGTLETNIIHTVDKEEYKKKLRNCF